VAFAAVAAGCGVGSDDAPRPLAADDVPFGLLEPRSTSTTSAPEAPAPNEVVQVYLLASDGRLEGVLRRVVATENRSTLAANALRVLLEGPTDEERAGGITSAIPTGTRLRGVLQPSDGVVTVDLSREFTTEGLEGRGQIAALAQVVFTATELDRISGVRFAIEGEPRAVPRGVAGGLTDAPLGRSAFPDLDPDGAPPPATTPAPSPPGR
jgi:spore germination protein GerM